MDGRFGRCVAPSSLHAHLDAVEGSFSDEFVRTPKVEQPPVRDADTPMEFTSAGSPSHSASTLSHSSSASSVTARALPPSLPSCAAAPPPSAPWHYTDPEWTSLWRMLRRYQEQTGNLDVPMAMPTLALACFVRDMHDARRAGALSATRLAWLESIGFPTREPPALSASSVPRMSPTVITADVPRFAAVCQASTPARGKGKGKGKGRKRARQQLAANLSWEQHLADLEECHRHCGDISNLRMAMEKSPVTSAWFIEQRRLMLSGQLTQSRAARFQKLCFPYDVDPNWDRMMVELCGFYGLFGHCDVPFEYAANPELGKWVRQQREWYAQGQQSRERVARLNSLGFKWTQSRPRVPWDTRFEQLVQFKAHHGHCNVPRGWPPNPQLAKWASNVRHRRQSLPPDRFRLLDSLGFQWRVDR